jgi:hypothetical protein
MGPKKLETSEEKKARLAKNRDAYLKKMTNKTLEDRAARLEKRPFRPRNVFKTQ